jgi:DNA-directed RNA polymerase subunit L
VPHPSVRNISVRVQSYQSQNTQATTILRQGLKDLNEIATHILTSFNDQFEEFENKMFD